MLVKEFLLHHTQIGELCVIRDAGWVCSCAYIDHEDLFVIPEHLAEQEVKIDSWGRLNVTDAHGIHSAVPCHYIDI